MYICAKFGQCRTKCTIPLKFRAKRPPLIRIIIDESLVNQGRFKKSQAINMLAKVTTLIKAPSTETKIYAKKAETPEFHFGVEVSCAPL